MKPSFKICVALLISILAFSCASTGAMQENVIDASVLVQEYILLSQEYSEIEEYEKALELLIEAQMLDKDNNEIVYMIARTAALAEQWEVALNSYNELYDMDNENLLLQKSIAWIYAQSGDLHTAEELFETLYSSHSYDKEINTNYILVLLANNNIEDAEQIFAEYVTLYPDEDNIVELQEKINSIKQDTQENKEESTI